MRFEQTIVIDAPIEAARTFFHDVVAVATCMPGIEDMRPVGPDTYEARLRIRLGFFSYALAGQAHVVEDTDGTWRMTATGSDGRVNASVTLEARLRELSATTTEVQAASDLQVAGPIGALGEPLIRRKASSMLQDFAKNLQRAMRSRPVA